MPWSRESFAQSASRPRRIAFKWNFSALGLHLLHEKVGVMRACKCAQVESFASVGLLDSVSARPGTCIPCKVWAFFASMLLSCSGYCHALRPKESKRSTVSGLPHVAVATTPSAVGSALGYGAQGRRGQAVGGERPRRATMARQVCRQLPLLPKQGVLHVCRGLVLPPEQREVSKAS